MLKRSRDSSESMTEEDLQDNPNFSTVPSGLPMQFTHIIGHQAKKSAIDDLFDLLNEEDAPSNLRCN